MVDQEVKPPEKEKFALVDSLEKTPKIYLRSCEETGDIDIKWDLKRKYEMLNEDRSVIGYIVERKRLLSELLSNILISSKRDYCIDILDKSGHLFMSMAHRPTLLGSRAYIKAYNGHPVGTIKRESSLKKRWYDLRDHKKNVFSQIKTSYAENQRFSILGMSGQERASVFISDEEQKSSEQPGRNKVVIVDFGNKKWLLPQRTIILGMGIVLMFECFESGIFQKLSKIIGRLQKDKSKDDKVSLS